MVRLRFLRFGLISLSLLAISGCAKPVMLAHGPSQTAGPHNVILFIGDGMGVSTLTAMRILAGQLEGKPGEETVLPWETYPHLALIKTYNTNQQVPDSAGTATAIMSGEKTKAGVIGMSDRALRADCASARGAELQTLLEKAAAAGRATGVVTTTRLTHATPATTYAHSPERDWESDAHMPEAAILAGCRDIARQFVEFKFGHGIDVALAGGRKNFMPKDMPDPEYPDQSGGRKDGRNLIGEWQQTYPHGAYVTSKAELDALDLTKTSHLLGLFEPSHMRYEADRKRDKAGEPSLTEMTQTAIRMLARKGKGYFLMVEAGRIDHAHHAGNAYNALHDGVELARAVAAANAITNESDTLIIVTADHSHSFTIAGYPKRGNPILGKVVGSDDHEKDGDADFTHAADGKPYTTLGYYAAPGAVSGARADLSDVDTTAETYRQQAVVPVTSGAHGGEDVAAFARGPNAEALHGVMEQNLLYDVMARALAFP
ncbi:alkaline phosphatase [Govanella unica]|uniref:Alkaline phosphatase n=1 Tax=Govanella unica TaxID=2975056 RepID=A0A9X3TVJ7_9PROT|nr:alkaline phosphatase [Govania unica]MDA5192536.1 alkaline phosphatase [Govania unica]